MQQRGAVTIFAHAIPQVEGATVGIHLLWHGPPTFGYAPGGWRIERRAQDPGSTSTLCEDLDAGKLATLRDLLELRLATGVATFRRSVFPGTATSCDVVTIELAAPQRDVTGTVTGTRAFVYGLRDGKAVSHAGPFGSGAFALGPQPIDRVVVYVEKPTLVRVCRPATDAWAGGALIKTLQIPIKELMPALVTPNDEYNEAKSRLLPGETLDQPRFAEVANRLRALVGGPGARPIDRVLLVRAVLAEDFEELGGLDPLRVLHASPLWRRVLGFAHFDTTGLVVGQRYDYRITGDGFPAADLADVRFGFHTVPSQTAVPRRFYLRDCFVRLAAPAIVRRAPKLVETGLQLASRTGIALAPSALGWLGELLEADAIIDLPVATTQLALELETGHALTYRAGATGGPLSAPAPVPAGANPVLVFGSPITQLRLSGTGFVFAVRVPSGASGTVSHASTLAGVKLENTPRPTPPIAARALNLQQPPPATPPPQPPAPQPLGFDARWTPAARPPVWPADEQAPPPLDHALFQLERRQEPAGPWQPVIKNQNLVAGTREQVLPLRFVRKHVDLMELYPEVPVAADRGVELGYQDTFRAPTDADPARRLVPDPGTSHRYRVRAVDAIGRPSTSWREAAPVRLEKRAAPPLPAAPTEVPADELTAPAPTGVTARVVVKGAPDLSAADAALLGDHDNAIVLAWGWHAKQRAIDPFAREFRVYFAPPLDGVDGELVAASPVPGIKGRYTATLALTRKVDADAARGLYLPAGYPFYVIGHTAGTAVTATLSTAVELVGGSLRVPALGPIRLPLKVAPRLGRPAGWAERMLIVPITTATQYEVVVHDRLTLTAAHPIDQAWIGVSAADDQSYVPDERPPPPGGSGRPGNESAIVAVVCRGRRMIKPALAVALPLGELPRVLAREPVDGPARFALDLGPYLPPEDTGLIPGELVQPEHVAAEEVAGAYRVDGAQLIARVVDRRDPSEAEATITLPTPGDHDQVIAALSGSDLEALRDHHLVWLAGAHPYRDRLFVAATPEPVPFAPFDQVLPPRGARYVYRVRRAEPPHQLSDDGAVAQVVVREPSLVPPPPPRASERRAGDPPSSIAFVVPAERRVTRALVFGHAVVPGEAELLRVPNTELPPRLRLADGTVIAASEVALDAIAPEPDGSRRVVATPALVPGQRIAVWAVALTDDGIPSAPGGPWGLWVPLPAPQPTLVATPAPPGLTLSWTFAGETAAVVLERATAASAWQRISPPLRTTSFAIAASPPGAQYRLRVVTGDGRTTTSNVVTG